MAPDQKLAFRRKSIPYMPGNPQPRDRAWADSSSVYTYSLIDDIRNHVTPYPERKNVSAKLMPEDTPYKGVILEALNVTSESWFADDLLKFIREVAAYLAHYGNVHYEMVRGMSTPSASSDQIVPFTLVHIPGRVFKLGSRCVQILPVVDGRHLPASFAVIPTADVWTVTVPTELGGNGAYQMLLKTLGKIGKPVPDFVEMRLKNRLEPKNFNFRDFERRREIGIASETSVWGWAARNLWEEHTLEYFQIYRRMRFAASMAILRDHILSSLNDLLARLHTNTQIALVGFPSAAEIDDAIGKLYRQEIGFKEAVRFV